MTTGRTTKMDLIIDDPSTLQFIQSMIEKSGDNEDVNRRLKTVNSVQSTGCKLPVKLTECSPGVWEIEFETTNTVVPALPVISKILHMDTEQTDNDALSFLNSLKQNDVDISEMENALTKWHNTREKLINQLHEISDKTRKNKRNTHIARIVGASTSTVGAVMCITTGILSFVTLGVATTLFVVSVVGACAAAVGGGVAAGASFTAKVLSSRGSKEANTLIEEDNVQFQSLKDVQQRYIDSLKILIKLTQINDKVVLKFTKIGGVISIAIRVGNNISKTISVVKAVRTEMKSVDGETVRVLSVITLGGKLVARILGSTSKYVVKAIGNVAIHLVDDIGKATKRTLGIVSKAAGITVSAAAIAVNIHTIVSSALDLSNNSPDKAADKIEEIAKDLANIDTPTLQDLVIESLIAAADELQIPHEGDINCSEDDHLFEDL